MAAYISVPRDLTRVKSKVFMNLTKRQCICFGTAVLSMLLSIISGGNNIMSLWILLINPLVNVANTVAGQMGETGLITEAALRLFSGGESLIIRGWSILGTALQLLMAAAMLLMAVANISPRRKKRKELDFEL